ISEEPKSMFGKLMSISDETMWEYFRLLTDFNLEELKRMHPKEAKLLLAENIVSFYYSKEIAKKEKEEFERIFSQRKIPQDIPIYKVKTKKINLIDIILEAGLVSSKNEIRRLFYQKGISLIDKNNTQQILKDYFIEVPLEGLVLKIGKQKFLKIVLV
ncbi:MAG: tyrosine--tRNA ligase, partial [Candidatus Aenigmatarchaeota archaeon]